MGTFCENPAGQGHPGGLRRCCGSPWNDHCLRRSALQPIPDGPAAAMSDSYGGSHMNIKRYFAPTAREALRRVKEELGADAIDRKSVV